MIPFKCPTPIRQWFASLAIVSTLLVLSSTGRLEAQSAITYQGRLTDNGAPANGNYDLTFTLYDAAIQGDPVGRPVTNAPTVVSNGVFTVILDFGGSVFDGSGRWIQLAVRPAGGGAFTPMSPRQAVTPAPYAHYALGAPPPPQGPWSVNGTNVFYSGGRVGIGTNTPQALVHAVGSDSRLRLESTSTFQDGPFLELVNKYRSSDTYTGGGIVFNDLDQATTARISYERYAFFPGFHTSGIRVYVPGSSFPLVNFSELGSVGLYGSVEISKRLYVGDSITAVTETNTVATFNRTGNDGVVVSIQQDNTPQGTISVSGSTVTYNAFTGSHYAWIDNPPERGALVRMTGQNRRQHDKPDSEIVYGIETTRRANDPACLGAYQSLLESAKPASSSNPHLVAAVGNGDLWVVSRGGTLQPGDLLISSDIEGCAMVDYPARFPVGYIIARAAEAVDWSTVKAGPDGLKRKRISVLFDSSIRGGDIHRMTRLLETQERRVASIEAELASLRVRLTELASARDLWNSPATNTTLKPGHPYRLVADSQQ